MTIKQAQRTVAAFGFTLRKTDWNEFRVNVRNGDESTAYYADSVVDAVDTAKHMARQMESRS